MNQWTIRRAKPTDAAALAASIDAAYSAYARKGIDLPAVSDGIREDIENNTVWVAILGLHVVGGLVLIPRDDHAILANVAVEPSAAGSGLGRALIDRAEAEARKLGIGRLILTTHADILKNVRMYEHLGWRETARIGNKVHMEKSLPS